MRKKLPAMLGLFLRNRQIPFNKEDVRKILVIRQDERIGNMLLTIPAIKLLRQACPNAVIDGLVSEKFQRFWQIPGIIDHFHYVNKKSFIRNPFGLFRLLRRLRKQKYDLAIDLSSADSISINSMIYTYFCRATWRLGYRREDSDRFLNIQVERQDSHEIDILVRILEPLAGIISLPEMTFAPNTDEIAFADDFLFEHNVYADPIGINLGGRKVKRWPHWLEVADALSRRVPVLLFGGPGEHSELKEAGYTPPEDVHLVPLSPVGHIGAVIGRCSLFITADTGLLHLAAAAGVSTVAVFAVENYDRYNPKGQKVYFPPPEPGELVEYIEKRLDE